MKKASNDQIKSSYQKLKSCRKVANLFGMCPQSVHERLVSMGINNQINILTDSEKTRIQEFYNSGFKRGDGKLKDFSKSIGRTIPFISRYAKSEGLSNKNRSVGAQVKENCSVNSKKWLEKNDHPKGMKGKTHSQEMKQSMSQRIKTYYKNLTPEKKALQYSKMVQSQRDNGVYNKPRGSWNSAWRTIGGKTKFFRSRWEANYARYLQLLKEKGEIIDWEHEPQTFWFLEIMRGSRSYLPDFKITKLDGTHYWIEVKGWMDSRSLTKLKRFAKYYPDEVLVLIRGDWFKKNSDELMRVIPDWEIELKKPKTKSEIFIGDLERI